VSEGRDDVEEAEGHDDPVPEEGDARAPASADAHAESKDTESNDDATAESNDDESTRADAARAEPIDDATDAEPNDAATAEPNDAATAEPTDAEPNDDESNDSESASFDEPTAKSNADDDGPNADLEAAQSAVRQRPVIPREVRTQLLGARVLLAIGALLVVAAVPAFFLLGVVFTTILATFGLGFALLGLSRRSAARQLLAGRAVLSSRVGKLPLVSRVLALVHQGVLGAILASFTILLPLALEYRGAALGAAVGVALLHLAVFVLDLFVWLRGARLRPGVVGRGRLMAGAATNLVFLLVVPIPITLLGAGTLSALDSGFLFSYSLEEPYLALAPDLRTVLIVSGVVTAAALVVDVALSIALWRLLPAVARKVFWGVFDLLAVGAAAYAIATLPVQPEGDELEHLQGPVFRLAATAIAAIRIFLRTLPFALDGIERSGFHANVAARHLRSRKSGFLATIGTLSILAVALSTCMLVTVLSVMGGFRNDLKQKILGNHAHVVVDKVEQAAFEGWDPTLSEIRRAEGVVAATPYVSGEVMVTSASNQAGAVLRGIDPETIGDVTDLEENLERGRLDYLVHPRRLLDLPADERRTILPLEFNPTQSETDGLIEEIDEAIRDADTLPTDEHEDEPAADDPILEDLLGDDSVRDEDVLPGIIVGRELARTLRLFVGDELDVVSPFGDLGPAGPMPKARRFRVAGIFYSGMYEYDMKLAYVTLEDGQRFLGTGDAINGIEVKVENVERSERVVAAIEGNLSRSDLQVQDWKQLNKNLFGALALEKLAMFVTLGIAILIAGFCVFGTLTLMVQEKGREVAILQAMGTGPRGVVGIFMLEGLLLGVLGSAIGVGLGYLLTFVFEHFGIRLNPEVYYIDRLPVHVDPTEFVVVGVSAVLVCLFATLFPAWVASRMRPVDALRYQ